MSFFLRWLTLPARALLIALQELKLHLLLYQFPLLLKLVLSSFVPHMQ